MALKKGVKVVVDNTISNTSVTIIEITEDKLEKILIMHVSQIKKVQDWKSALAFVVAFGGMIFSSNFHETLGLKPDTILGIVWMCLVISLIYFGKCFINFCKNKDNVDDILNEIKKEKE